VSVTVSDQQLARPIEIILSDVDGVLTDGRIVVDNHGVETKQFHVRDGLGIKLWQQAGQSDKRKAMLDILQQYGYRPEQVCYIGDDLPDLPVLYEVGLPVTVADAAMEVRQTARWITQASGGNGAVRELIERLLRAKSRWDDFVPTPLPPVSSN
jgi:3-deoxy-D-manno-octulosonate 8-phosphate phosphatase KdsC-like HAD superfamily phosphatase